MDIGVPVREVVIEPVEEPIQKVFPRELRVGEGPDDQDSGQD